MPWPHLGRCTPRRVARAATVPRAPSRRGSPRSAAGRAWSRSTARRSSLLPQGVCARARDGKRGAPGGWQARSHGAALRSALPHPDASAPRLMKRRCWRWCWCWCGPVLELRWSAAGDWITTGDLPAPHPRRCPDAQLLQDGW